MVFIIESSCELSVSGGTIRPDLWTVHLTGQWPPWRKCGRLTMS